MNEAFFKVDRNLDLDGLWPYFFTVEQILGVEGTVGDSI